MKNKIEALFDKTNGIFAYYVEDLNSGQVFQKNGQLRFHAASMIKLFYLYEALRQVDDEKLSLDNLYTLDCNDKVGGCGALKLLRDGIELSLLDLLNLMIQLSDNSATNMLFDILGKDNINQALCDIEINNTLVARKLMVVIPNLFSYSTAQDIATILKEFYQPRKLSKASAALAMKILYGQQFNDCLNGDLIFCGNCQKLIKNDNICPYCGYDSDKIEPIQIPFAHKTGSIQGHVHDGGIFSYKGQSIVAVLLSSKLDNNQKGIALQRDFGRLLYQHYFTVQ